MKLNYKFRQDTHDIKQTKNKKHNRNAFIKKHKDMIACESANYNMKDVA